MAEKDTLIPPSPPTDVSPRAISIGRMIDRLCQTPGSYIITVQVPAHPRARWQITFNKLDFLQRTDVGR